MSSVERPRRAKRFTYRSLEVHPYRLVGRYSLDDEPFTEEVTFEGVGPLDAPAPAALAGLWYLVAGLSYYKAGAPSMVELGDHPTGRAGHALLRAALIDGLGEFAYRNQLPLDGVYLDGGGAPVVPVVAGGAGVLVPFGGGIDSIVTLDLLARHTDNALFIVSPAAGRFAAIEAPAEVTGWPVVRATRQLDPRIVAKDPHHLQGHVPVTAMITLLAAVAAAASGRSGVVLSNEHSASVPNLEWRGREVNHQWSKSAAAELLLANAVAERVPALGVASALRSRSETWVAGRFAALTTFHQVFRSCNRAFAQDPAKRLDHWCGECDKCLFVDLVLAPFIDRPRLKEMLGVEPLSDPARVDQLKVLVGLGESRKPFECVGDPTECAAALRAVAQMAPWADVHHLATLSATVAPGPDLDDLNREQGESRVPAAWLR